MSSVDLGVPEGIPITGVITSDNGSISIGDYEIMKVQRGNMRFDNGVRLFRPAGTRIGTTYCSNQRVTGQITGALLNFGVMRWLMGAKPGYKLGDETFYPGPGVLTPKHVIKMLEALQMPIDHSLDHFYPFKVNVELMVNKEQFATINIEKADENEIITGSLYCPKCAHSYLVRDGIPSLLPSQSS